MKPERLLVVNISGMVQQEISYQQQAYPRNKKEFTDFYWACDAVGKLMVTNSSELDNKTHQATV